MTAREHLETLLMNYGELLMSSDPSNSNALEAVATDIETLINQVSEERVKAIFNRIAKAYDQHEYQNEARKQLSLAFWHEYHDLNKPQEPQTNGDLVGGMK